MITINIPSLPVAQPRQRHRVISSGNKHFATNYTPKNDPVNTFKACIQHAAKLAFDGAPLEGPVCMNIDFVFARPKSVAKKLGTGRMLHTVKPDRDNLAKAVQDALNGIVYRDDAQICDGVIRKFRAAEGEQPHVRIELIELEV